MSDLPRVSIGMSSSDRMDTRTSFRMMGMLLQHTMERPGLPAFKIAGLGNAQSNVSHSHHLLVQRALDVNADYLMMIDCDMDFPEDVIHYLLSKDKDIIGAPYLARGVPHHLMAWPEEGDDYTFYPGMRKMRQLGSGMMLVNTRVFRQIPYPWFPERYGTKLADFVGTDISFCRLVRSHGFEIWGDYDLSLRISHMAGDYPLRVTGHEANPEKLK